MEETGGNERDGNLRKHWATRARRLVEKPVSRRKGKIGDDVPDTDAAKEREISHESENDKGRA